MAVTEKGEIELNGKKYRVKPPGDVTSVFLDPFPEQQAIGDPSYSNRRDLSSWQINPVLGIGVDEMDEANPLDAYKCWWTNCITKYRNHILPPRKATAITAPTQPATITPTLVNADMELTTGWTDGTRDATHAHGGTYAFTFGAATVYQNAATWDNSWRGRNFTFTIWIWADSGTCTAQIDDGVTVFSGTASGAGGAAWVSITVNATLGATATRLRVQVVGSAASNWMDDATIAATNSTIGTAAKFVNFNSVLYVALGAYIYKMASDRASWTFVAEMPATITALIASLNTKLYIYQGDSTNYRHMTTGEVISQSKTANANWGFQYDAKLFKCNTSGTVTYSTDPDGATPTWTAAGTITDIAADIQGFVVGRDASTVPFCSTKSRIKVYDSTGPSWDDTEMSLGSHPNGGKGATYFNGKVYFSAGLAVWEFNPDTGDFKDIGLTTRDGLPAEYNGEIVHLQGDTGMKLLFALVDASQVTGTGKSGLYSYDGAGWDCWWADTSNDRALTESIVSSASSAYAVYWDVAGTVNYIDIPRGINNPDKITQSYATAGIFLSPWFDAGNQGAVKLAKVLADFAKGVTTTETVALKYRIDHANTDLDTGWTTLDTLNTTGETGYNEELFASGAGLEFKAIQFRMDFVTGGSTAKADIQTLVLNYKKRTGGEKIRKWFMTVLLDDYDTTKPKEKDTNLAAAIRSATDVTFSYHPNDTGDSESFYVSVDGKYSQDTGQNYQGEYALELTEV